MRHLIFALILFPFCVTGQQIYELNGPDGQLKVIVDVGGDIGFTAEYNGETTISRSIISLDIEGKDLSDPRVRKSRTNSTDEHLHPVVPLKTSDIHNLYNELILQFKGNFEVHFRAFNDGMAYRFATRFKDSIQVNNEELKLNFTQGTTSLFPLEESLISHYEREYIPARLDTIKPDSFCSLPVLMKSNEVNVLLTEADLYDYPGLFMYGTSADGLSSGFQNNIQKSTPAVNGSDRNEILTYENFIARTNGNRSFPWRVMIISDNDGDLIESNLVYQLSRETEMTSTAWIKPGMVAWDWYNANNIYGVDFVSGLNTATYKYYIDFASAFGLDYIILDEGWSKSTTEVRESNPDIDVHELIRYGAEKNVGVILWLLWGPVDKDPGLLELYGEWGAKGVKIDFMQRADQDMVNYYERIARIAAENKLLVDYHGSYKPSGLRRAYPNVISYEGVKGNENNKWSQDVTPEHTVTLPFTRMVAGPMDFTPGSLRNRHLINHAISFDRPISLGTRSHQVAMYVVYESPLQMMCESPSSYYREEETTKFIAQFPTVWDETKVLEAAVGDYLIVARRNGDKWYIGGMTDDDSREFVLDLSFLSGNYQAQIMKDGMNAHKYAEDYVLEKVEVSEITKLPVKMVSGGGWAAILSPLD